VTDASPRPRLIEGGLEHPAPDVSVVVPAHNEEPALRALVARVRDTLEREGRTWELVIVDDGSRDGSAELLAELHAEDPRVRVRVLRTRHGKSAALDVAMRSARGAVVVTMDADLQDQPEEIPVLLAAIDSGLDVVQAWRVEREDTPFKVFASWVFNGLCSLFSGLRLNDVNCGFKALRLDAVRGLRLDADMHRFIPVLLHRQGFKVGEVQVRHARRAHGRSKYGLLRYFRGFNDLIGVVLLPRLLHGIAPLLGPLGVLLLLSSAGFLATLVAFAVTGRVGLLWELGLSALGTFGIGLLSFSLAYQARMGFTAEQADRARHPDVSQSLG
jgi:glycosyltransferase involved in cell wall biosynthesis